MTLNDAATYDCRFFLPYTPPYRWDRMLSFLAMRAIPGVETVRDGSYLRTVRVCGNADVPMSGWIRATNDAENNRIEIEYSPHLEPARAHLIRRLKHLFDTERDPANIGGKLESMNACREGSFVPGTRIPGCYDGFEMACRAVLGQQISVKSAGTLAGRMAKTLGTPFATGVPGLTHTFPTPASLCALAESTPIEQILGPLGIIGARARTIYALAELLRRNPAILDPCTETGASPEETIKALTALPGIGEWTAHYLAMRALGYSDAFPATDLGIIKFLGTKKKKELIAAAEKWRPWRAYAVMNMWTTEEEDASMNKQHATQAAQTIATAWYQTPFMGRLMLAATDQAIVGAWMEGQKYFGASMPAGSVAENPDHPLIRKAFLWLDRYFAGEQPAISDIPLAPQGSAFRQVIWKLLCEIPYGETTTYGTLAEKAAPLLGKEHMASLAVGGAVGHNPISVIIPCHRVVGANGSLTGYAGGLDRKIALLKHEGVCVDELFRPTQGTAL